VLAVVLSFKARSKAWSRVPRATQWLQQPDYRLLIPIKRVSYFFATRPPSTLCSLKIPMLLQASILLNGRKGIGVPK
jgi:hypothetical protein